MGRRLIIFWLKTLMLECVIAKPFMFCVLINTLKMGTTKTIPWFSLRLCFFLKWISTYLLFTRCLTYYLPIGETLTGGTEFLMWDPLDSSMQGSSSSIHFHHPYFCLSLAAFVCFKSMEKSNRPWKMFTLLWSLSIKTRHHHQMLFWKANHEGYQSAATATSIPHWWFNRRTSFTTSSAFFMHKMASLNFVFGAPKRQKKLLVLGSGVVGLNTALRLQTDHPEAEITIMAEKFDSELVLLSNLFSSFHFPTLNYLFSFFFVLKGYQPLMRLFCFFQGVIRGCRFL